MVAIVLIDHRLALLTLELPAPGPAPEELTSNQKAGAKNDPCALFLLVCVTLSYVLRFPGFPVATGLQWLSTLLPMNYFHWTVLGARAFFVVVPGLAAAYSALRPNPLRIALIAGGLLVTALWLVNPALRAAIATG
jgi:hypothetical protein